jgi:hypothetical protein
MSKTEVEKLFAAFRGHPILYEWNKSYKDTNRKATAWTKIAEELGMIGK